MNKKRIPVCVPMLDGNELEYVSDAVRTGWISSSGEYVERFEKSFAEYCGCKHAIAVTNGTVALHLALLACGIGKGDEVIIPSFTMISSAFAICYTGAMPIFVDVDPKTWDIDVNKIESSVTPNTKAIMPVHVFGNPCDMDAIVDISEKHGLYIVEDAAEAHGAEYKGRKVGRFSSVGAFSFFANKNITTGEGGICVTDNDLMDERCRYFKNLCFPVGGPRNYIHEDIGFNYRMSNLHAAIGLAQVELADVYKKKRIKNHRIYVEKLRDCPGIVFQMDTESSLNVNWMNAVVVDEKEFGRNRDELGDELRKRGIETRVLFKSMARQPSLKKYGCNCDDNYPVTEWLSECGLYLPSASSLTYEEVSYICDSIIECAR